MATATHFFAEALELVLEILTMVTRYMCRPETFVI